jgi:hypothetical protein
VSRRQIGDARLEVMRRGTLVRPELKLAKYSALVPAPQPDRRQPYFIYAGLVFTTLTYEYMHNWEWAQEHHRYANCYYERFPSQEQAEIVLVHEVLAHEINLGYHQVRGAIVERVNGIRIRELRDVVRAIATPLDRFTSSRPTIMPRRESSTIATAYGTRIAVDAGRAERHREIPQNGIAYDRSIDLRGTRRGTCHDHASWRSRRLAHAIEPAVAADWTPTRA